MTQSDTMKEPHEGMRTPWGKAQNVQRQCKGVWYVSTAGHGGLKVDAARNRRIPACVRGAGGWYEGDLQYLWVLACIPEARTASSSTEEQIHAGLRDWFPIEYEKAFGVAVLPDQSHVRREQLYCAAHSTAWIAIAARGDWHTRVPEGMVGLTCRQVAVTRVFGSPTRSFLVPKADYHNKALHSPIGFVVEPAPREGVVYQEVEAFV